MPGNVRMARFSSLPFGSTKTFSNGQVIPQLGFGVYEIVGDECRRAVTFALEAGYRHIDSAEWYGNERECGQAILEFCKKSGMPREDVFFTSKLMVNSTYDHAAKSLRKSIKDSGLGYLDLYLIHGPYPGKQQRLDSWRALEDAVDEGLIRSIGVSNYGSRHLQELFDARPRIMPVINQIDLHPFMTRESEVAFNENHNIVLEAWGPLGRAMRFDHPVLGTVAKRYNRSPAQIMIRWGLQKGFVEIPKSVSKARIDANAKVFDFELTDADMKKLSKLDEYLVTDWDPIGDKNI